MRIAIALSFLATLCPAQVQRQKLAQVLNFEDQKAAEPLTGWGGGPRETQFADDKIVHGGKYAARLERNADSASNFSTITLALPIDFTGKSIELRGFLKTENVTEFVGLWMREDADKGAVAFDNMQDRKIKDTHDWAEYSIELPLRPEAKTLVFGVLTSGTGTAWVDDLQLLVDGQPIWDLPVVEKPKTSLDLDHEFDRGSAIKLDALSKVQIENLATLGKVWGFLKYHHPLIASGQRHWDYDLFRIMPKVIAAPDRPSANSAIHDWIQTFGNVKECAPCATLNETDLYLKAELSWIDDKTLGSELGRDLRSILRNRVKNGFFVSLSPGIQNPVFEHEPSYQAIHLPDPGFQMLALYRVWNIIDYWYPYRDVVGENWDDVLPAFLPRIALAKTRDDYQREMLAFIAQVHDTHANLWSSIQVLPPVGKCRLPALVRFAEGSPVVFEPAGDLKIGDVILSLDGTPVRQWIERWSPYYAASNEPTRLRDLSRLMTRGDCGPATLEVRRDGQTVAVKTDRVPSGKVIVKSEMVHDLPGPVFRKLSDDVAYLKLSDVKITDAAQYIESANNTKGLIIDIRNYPSEFVVFAIGALLVDKETEFVRFTHGDLENPGAFHWGPALSLTPQAPHYNGKIVILVDETSQSQAEYTTMAFRSARGAVVVGSTTAGADGNVSPIPVPGGFNTMISGLGVFYPDKKPTQRIGIIPDVEVKPTIAGIRAGRDEVLEAALRQILGKDAPSSQIESIARHQ